MTELQRTILDDMSDDFEDIEQLYLHANQIQAHQAQVEIRFPLRDIIDEVAILLHEGYIMAKYPNDEHKHHCSR